MGKPEGKLPFGRPRHDGMIILKWIFKEDGALELINLPQDRINLHALVNTVMKLQV